MSAPVSVIMRTAGEREAMLRAALRSALDQTVRPFEIVVVEDGGARMQQAVADTAAGAGIRLVYEPMAKGGRGAAADRGLRLASGALACFLDDDDEFYHEHIEVLTAALAAAPEAVAAYARADAVPVAARAARGRPQPLQPFSRTMLMAANYLPIQTVLFRRAAALACGGVAPSLQALEDWDLWLRLAAAGPFVAVDRVTSSFRVPGSRSGRRERADAHAPALAQVRARQAELPPIPAADVGEALERIRERPDLILDSRLIARYLSRKLRPDR